jgi:type IV pilus assembly protein PilO
MEMLRGTVTAKDWMAVGVIIGLTLVLCAVFYFFVFQPKTEELVGLTALTQVKAGELETAEQLAKDIDALRAKVDKTDELVQAFEKRLPSKREIPTLLTQFEAMAKQVGVDVELTTKPTTRDASKATIPYGIVARGTFHQIASFINELERYERYLKVSELKIGEEEARVCEATFILSTFTFIENKSGDSS